MSNAPKTKVAEKAKQETLKAAKKKLEEQEAQVAETLAAQIEYDDRKTMLYGRTFESLSNHRAFKIFLRNFGGVSGADQMFKDLAHALKEKYPKSSDRQTYLNGAMFVELLKIPEFCTGLDDFEIQYVIDDKNKRVDVRTHPKLKILG